MKENEKGKVSVVKQVPPFLFPLIVNRGISLHNDRGRRSKQLPPPFDS